MMASAGTSWNGWRVVGLRSDPPRADGRSAEGQRAASHIAARLAEAVRRAGFEALIASHTAVLEAVARKLCRDRAAASDLVQDALERAWRRFDSLQDAERARGWLVRILRNAWLDQLRRRREEVSLEDTCEPAVAAADEPSRWERVTAEDLRRAIEALPEPYRSVAVMHDLEGLTYREIARRQGIPNATAATRLHRAHLRLRELLQHRLDGFS